MKKLFLIRHAKSSWDNPTLSDVDRPLNARGESNAPEMAKRLSEKWEAPELVLCSHARRAVQTAEKLGVIWWPEQELTICKELYEASPSMIIDLLSGVKNETLSVAVVFHNPSITILGNLLASIEIENVPTCGVVALEYENRNWRDLEVGSCRLLDFDYPKKKTL